MTTPAPAHIVDCTITELAPAVTDPVTGAVLKPPTLQMPRTWQITLGEDTATLIDPDSGQPIPSETVPLTTLNLPTPETPDDWQQRQTQAANDTAAALTTMQATNKQTLLHTRNRWLGETDAYMLPTAAYPADMPDDVTQAIADNQTAIAAWRTQLRDWPATVTDWADPPALPAPPTITLTSGRQLIIVT